MSAITQLSVRSSGNVTKTLTPVRVTGDLVSYADVSAQKILNRVTADFSLRRPSNGSRNYKANIKLVVPIGSESVDPATGLESRPYCQANIQVLIPDSATNSERANMLGAIADLFDDANVAPVTDMSTLIADLVVPY